VEKLTIRDIEIMVDLLHVQMDDLRGHFSNESCKDIYDDYSFIVMKLNMQLKQLQC